MKKNEWFASWFDTPYYHILYKHRDFKEAEHFINNLLSSLPLQEDSRILDLACGRGRHAYYIAKQGFKVTGVDLSEQSINWAKQEFSLGNLNFDVHDMRKTYKKDSFDFVFNIFTSFGYFNSTKDNQDVVHGMCEDLAPNGTLVIDFMNAHKSIKGIVNSEQKEIEGILFHIKREIVNGQFIKEISFEDKGQTFSFEEKVQALTLEDFKALFTEAKLKLDKVYGNYDLDTYDPDVSDRLIMILRKDD